MIVQLTHTLAKRYAAFAVRKVMNGCLRSDHKSEGLGYVDTCYDEWTNVRMIFIDTPAADLVGCCEVFIKEVNRLMEHIPDDADSIRKIESPGYCDHICEVLGVEFDQDVHDYLPE